MAKANEKKRVEAEFFKTKATNEPVRDELIKLGRPIKTEIGADILFVERNWKLDRPHVDQLRKQNSSTEKTIYEVRSTVAGKEYRTLFFVYENRMILVHLFEKKTQRTQKREIDIAWDRMKLWMAEELRNKKSSPTTHKKVTKKAGTK